MKNIVAYERYTEARINEGWISDTVKTLGAGIGVAVKGFAAPFTGLINKVKTEWKDGSNAEKIREQLLYAINQSFKSLLASSKKVKSRDDANALYAELGKSIKALRKQLWGAIDQYVNESAVNESAGTLKAITGGLLDIVSAAVSNAAAEYKDAVAKQKDVNELRNAVSAKIKAVWDKVKAEIKETDIRSLIKDRRAGNAAGTGSLKPGSKVTYVKRDGTQNTAVVADDQSDASHGHTVLRSLKTNSAFQVPTDKIITTKDVGGDTGDDASGVRKRVADRIGKMDDRQLLAIAKKLGIA